MSVSAHVHSVAPQERPAAPSIRVEDPLTLVIFGASGDLTARKLLPALYAVQEDGHLPDDLRVLGVARRDWTETFFQDRICEAVRSHSRVPVTDESLARFRARVTYQRCDLSASADYAALKERLAGDGFPPHHLFYLAIASHLFAPVIASLHEQGLVRPAHERPWSRVVIEKPFGHDLKSARALNQEILGHLDESQIYRIDHYLGKETVQNILSFRLANSIFEPLFNRKYVHHVQITAAETVGMESGRGGYYDSAGALRDMVQNHLLQLLCLVAMEPPSGLDATAIHNEKVKVLQSIRPLTPEAVREQIVRAQYSAGTVGGEQKVGYREEDRVAPDSRTESFVAMRLAIENWRWAGVPFYLRTGKRMPRQKTEISVTFRRAPMQLFQTVECEGDVCDLSGAKPNVLTFRIQPNEGISLDFSAKRPELQVVVEGVNMDFSYEEAWSKRVPAAYERLLLDVMRGDATLFNRSDEVVAAWQIVDAVLSEWQAHPEIPVASYPAGTWGPVEAEAFMATTDGGWRND